MSVDRSLLYLIADLDHPNKVWTKLSDQFCKKTWANKLELRRKLLSLLLKEEDSVQVHTKRMMELFGQLAEIDSPLTEEEKVGYLLASLPDSFGVLVTALEASSEVPKMDMVSERLLLEERKIKNRDICSTKDEQVRMAKSKGQKKGNCFRFGKKGHLKRDCRVVLVNKDSHKAKFTATVSEYDGALVVGDSALIAGSLSANWIVDSGATSHMCSDKNLFVSYEKLQRM